MRSRMILFPHIKRAALAAAGLMALTCGTGCEPILFPKDSPRTQFSNYDKMRNQYAPEKELNSLGQEVPALVQRLSPKD